MSPGLDALVTGSWGNYRAHIGLFPFLGEHCPSLHTQIHTHTLFQKDDNRCINNGNKFECLFSYVLANASENYLLSITFLCPKYSFKPPFFSSNTQNWFWPRLSKELEVSATQNGKERGLCPQTPMLLKKNVILDSFSMTVIDFYILNTLPQSYLLPSLLLFLSSPPTCNTFVLLLFYTTWEIA